MSNKVNTLYNIKKSIEVSSSCWVRILSYSGHNAWYGGSEIVDIYIVRPWAHTKPDVHMFTAMHVTKEVVLGNIVNTTAGLVDKLRVMYVGDDFFAYDIHYNYNNYNEIYVELIPRTTVSIQYIVDEPMKIVEDSPSGESLYKEFSLTN